MVVVARLEAMYQGGAAKSVTTVTLGQPRANPAHRATTATLAAVGTVIIEASLRHGQAMGAATAENERGLHPRTRNHEDRIMVNLTRGNGGEAQVSNGEAGADIDTEAAATPRLTTTTNNNNGNNNGNNRSQQFSKLSRRLPSTTR